MSHVMHEALPADVMAILDARAAELARPVEDDGAAESVDVIPFGIRGHDFAAPVRGVREVRRLQVVARVPQAPPALLGVARVRSTILPVFDLVLLLGLDPGISAMDTTWVLVLDAPGRAPFALAAEWVDGVQPQPIAQILSGEADHQPGSLGTTPEGVIVLDTDVLLETPPVFGDAAAAAAPLAAKAGNERGTNERGKQ